MLSDILPTSTWVNLKFQDPRIGATTDGWLVAKEDLIEIITKHFNDQGIYSIPPRLEKECFEAMLNWLEHSPEIFLLVKETQDEADRKKARRRKDSSTMNQ